MPKGGPKRNEQTSALAKRHNQKKRTSRNGGSILASKGVFPNKQLPQVEETRRSLSSVRPSSDCPVPFPSPRPPGLAVMHFSDTCLGLHH